MSIRSRFLTSLRLIVSLSFCLCASISGISNSQPLLQTAPRGQPGPEGRQPRAGGAARPEDPAGERARRPGLRPQGGPGFSFVVLFNSFKSIVIC